MSRWKSAGLIGLMTLVLAGCGGEETPPPAPTLVRAMTVTLDSPGRWSVYSGSVRGRYESNLSFQVPGKILTRRVDLGSRVQAGELLFEIDPKDLQEKVSLYAAQADAARSQLALARLEFQRYQRLFEDQAVSKSQFDHYRTSYEAAVETLKQATAQHNQSRNELDYSRLRADGQGVVSEIMAEAGQVVAAGQTVARLVRTGELEVEITVPENKISDLSLGHEAEVTFWALPGLSLTGRVREIAPMADQTTRTYPARVNLGQPPPEVQLGMTASVKMSPAGNRELKAAILPLSALYQTGDRPGVWVVEDGRVGLRPVAVEGFDENQVLVTEGLAEGEVVVTAGVQKLYEGQPVRLMDENK